MADIAGTNATQEPSKALFATWAAGGANVEPSAKMLALIGFLQEWESTGDKTICFSQCMFMAFFLCLRQANSCPGTSMLDLVDTLFARYGIQSLRYDGSMTREQREGVLAKFRKTGGPKVILISIKCGGVGLNLTSANRIVKYVFCSLHNCGNVERRLSALTCRGTMRPSHRRTTVFIGLDRRKKSS